MWLHVYHIVPNPHNNSENFSAQFNACVQEICTATFIKHNGMKSFLKDAFYFLCICAFTGNLFNFPMFIVVHTIFVPHKLIKEKVA